eukprot:365676-Chlamydomonas_euryale.AAC.6
MGRPMTILIGVVCGMGVHHLPRITSGTAPAGRKSTKRTHSSAQRLPSLNCSNTVHLRVTCTRSITKCCVAATKLGANRAHGSASLSMRAVLYTGPVPSAGQFFGNRAPPCAQAAPLSLLLVIWGLTWNRKWLGFRGQRVKIGVEHDSVGGQGWVGLFLGFGGTVIRGAARQHGEPSV